MKSGSSTFFPFYDYIAKDIFILALADYTVITSNKV